MHRTVLPLEKDYLETCLFCVPWGKAVPWCVKQKCNVFSVGFVDMHFLKFCYVSVLTGWSWMAMAWDGGGSQTFTTSHIVTCRIKFRICDVLESARRLWSRPFSLSNSHVFELIQKQPLRGMKRNSIEKETVVL